MSGTFWRRRGSGRRIAIAAAAAALVTAMVALLPRDNPAEGLLTDITVALRVQLFGPDPLDSAHVVVVGMDRRSLESPELMAQPRVLFSPVYAELVDKVLGHGGRAVVLDLILAYDAATLQIGDETPLRSLDTPFLMALRNTRGTGRLILGWSAELPPARRFLQLAGVESLGLVEIPSGAGNVIRAVPAQMLDLDGQARQTLSGRGRAAAGDTTTDPVHLLPPAPLDTLPSVSLIDVHRCGDDAALERLFSGRVVLLGGMLPGEDRLKFADRLIAQPTPWLGPPSPEPCEFPRPRTRRPGESTLPGVYAHAAAIDGAMSGWAPERVPRAIVLALAGALAFGAAILAQWLNPAVGGIALGAALGVTALVGAAALELGHFLPVDGPLFAALAGFGGTWGVRLGLLDRRANSIRRAFGHYLSPVLVDRMLDRGEMPALGGEERDVSVMFADLSGFTATSESLQSDELTAILNRYLDRIAAVIRDREGYVDKFIGDAVMAIWNAPGPVANHGLAAVDAGFQIHAAVEAMAAEDRARGDPAFSIKIGISSGPATVGNVGAKDRLNYTVIGETVNLAARFESLPGLFRTPIVIGPATAGMITDAYAVMPIVSIQVKGKSRGVRVYAPLYRRDEQPAWLPECFEDHAIALAAFEEGQFETAAALWQGLAQRDWPGKGIAAAMREEAQRLDATLMLTPWTGVLEARGK